MHHGYLRTSTKTQLLRRQEEGLRSICDQLWVEKGVSAAAKHRPVFDALMHILKKGDTFVVWDLDRAFRSTIDALTTAEMLRKREVALQIVTMQIDTSTPQGKHTYTIWAANCEYERALLIQRTKDGLAAAKKRGTQLGRKPKLSPSQIHQIRQAAKENRPVNKKAVARRYGVSLQTIRRILS